MVLAEMHVLDGRFQPIRRRSSSEGLFHVAFLNFLTSRMNALSCTLCQTPTTSFLALTERMRTVQRRLLARMSDEAATLRSQIATLEARLQQLERIQALPGKKAAKVFDMSTHPRRKIALLFSYEGWHYSGLAYQNQYTPLPTVEGEIMKALQTARLVDLEESFEDVGFSRCGRTDRGVSSSGQVVSLWVRSNLAAEALEGTQALSPGTPLNRIKKSQRDSASDDESEDASSRDSRNPPAAPLLKANNAGSSRAEFNYAQLLNKILPPAIRMLAWSPVDRLFDARFSCLGRHYKYFFTSSPSHPLDIQAMQQACTLLLGEHDFRNMCKIDASKQINNFCRRIQAASISLLPTQDQHAEHYVFDLHGTAFLYHQVRHIMALLFLIGSKLEPPSLISQLLDVEHCPTKPDYEMAHEAPLVLWKCDFASRALNWQIDESAPDRMSALLELPAVHQHVRALHREALMSLVPVQPSPSSTSTLAAQLGAGTMMRTSKQKYIPLMKRQRGDHFELVNQRWRNTEKGRRIMARYNDQNQDHAGPEENHA